MEIKTFIKKSIFYAVLFTSILVNSQKITFNIENNSGNKTMFLTNIEDKILKNIYDTEDTFVVDFLNLEEGYYFLKKQEKTIILYLKSTDELKINFDNDNFYNSLNFSGEGAYVNSYLHNKTTELLNKEGDLIGFYKKEFYEGNEEEYLTKLDKLYRENYGVLFGGQLGKKFVDHEMKNLKYGYSVDLLKYQEAKKYYRIKDSLAPSKAFLKPLNAVNFNNNQLYEKYVSYKELRVLKWKKSIAQKNSYSSMEKVFSSIRNKQLKEAVLESLYKDMNSRYPIKSIDYYQLIKKYSKSSKLILNARHKYAEIKHLEALRNLSKFKFLNLDKEEEKLSQFKGRYIFINVWTSWCKPCIKEFEDLKKLEEKYKDKPINFVSISVDKRENINEWIKITKEHHPDGNNLLLNDYESGFIVTYGLNSIPSFLLISPRGLPLDIEIKKIGGNKTKQILNELLDN